jgi:hypothetical protein
LYQPETMLRPKRPGQAASIVTAIFAQTAGCRDSNVTDGISLMRFVTGASSAVSV